ncbi:MAG: aminotransferase class V-fold PLP-dependent enzyme, partial [Bacteriovoracaceae bacterium]|nr:aminotransferase class V-fold PLP-dependent enzyme [Bacteriovoracaceae bacterium]
MATSNFLETTDLVKKWRNDFPQLQSSVRGKPLVYFDNAATTLKPQKMIDAISHHYAFEVSNIHRGVHFNSETGTKKYEETREFIKNFLNARFSHEIIFTKGTTDSINLLANSYGEKHLNKGDVILLSEMEHHSNIVPWQMVAERTGAIVRYIPIFDNGELNYDEYLNLIKTLPVKILSITHVSNTLGTINPIKKIISDLRALKPLAHVMIDA